MGAYWSASITHSAIETQMQIQAIRATHARSIGAAIASPLQPIEAPVVATTRKIHGREVFAADASTRVLARRLDRTAIISGMMKCAAIALAGIGAARLRRVASKSRRFVLAAW
jgi:hypothetical protein